MKVAMRMVYSHNKVLTKGVPMRKILIHELATRVVAMGTVAMRM